MDVQNTVQGVSRNTPGRYINKTARVADPSHMDRTSRSSPAVKARDRRSRAFRPENFDECDPCDEDQTRGQFYFYHTPQTPSKLGELGVL